MPKYNWPRCIISYRNTYVIFMLRKFRFQFFRKWDCGVLNIHICFFVLFQSESHNYPNNNIRSNVSARLFKVCTEDKVCTCIDELCLCSCVLRSTHFFCCAIHKPQMMYLYTDCAYPFVSKCVHWPASTIRMCVVVCRKVQYTNHKRCIYTSFVLVRLYWNWVCAKRAVWILPQKQRRTIHQEARR